MRDVMLVGGHTCAQTNAAEQTCASYKPCLTYIMLYDQFTE